MGFPVSYTDINIPKILLHLLTFLGILRKLIFSFFRSVGISDFLETNASFAASIDSLPSVTAHLIRQLLPVVKFSDHLNLHPNLTESCAVCLYEFEQSDKIRTLINCRHIFHRTCVDRWMDHERKTCPLCRTPFVPESLQDDFNERLWAATGISDYYGDS